MAKTAAGLREQAKKFNEQAKRLNDQASLIEQKRALRIGKEVLKHAETDFKDFNITTLKEFVKSEE